MKRVSIVFLLPVLLLGSLFLSSCGKEKKQTLVMVTEATFPPYEFREGGKIVGIDPEVVEEVARRNDLILKIEDMSFDSVIAAVQTGKADVAASGITVTEDRKRMVNFTIPYVKAEQVIILPVKTSIKKVSDLKGKKIGVQHGTTGDQYVAKHLQAPQRFANGGLAVAALLAGKLDAVVLDNAPAEVFLKREPAKLKRLAAALTSEEYAYAISKKRPELLKLFNDTLQEMIKDGTLQKILDKHLKKKGAAAENGNQKKATFWTGFAEECKVNFISNKRYLYLLRGFLVTLEVAAGAVLLGILIGFGVAVVRSAADQTGKWKVLDWFCRGYLTVIRGTPVVVQLLIIYFVIFGAVDINKVLVAILAFGLNSGAYVAEIIRAGIMSIDKGQLEAGRSLGLSYGKTMIFIILPQALKNVLPALGNEFIVLLKETSVSGYIALEDLTKGGDIIRSQTYNAFLPLVMVALIYLAVVMFFTKLLGILEKRLKKNE